MGSSSAERSATTTVGFIATKPIQVIASLILRRQLSLDRATLCVVPTFADGDAVARRLAVRRDGFVEVFTAKDRVRALIAHALRGHATVFLDRDVGARSTVVMRLVHTLRPRVRFSVYEEGLSLFEPPTRERPRRLYELLGATPTIGEGALTSEVWTYTPEDLRARLPTQRLMRIVETPAAFMESERDLLAHVFWPTYEDDTRGWGGARCCLYLSSWQIDPRGLAFLRESAGFGLFKPHPHILDAVAQNDVADQVLSATIPAELVVLALARVFDEVCVLHDDSSTARYVSLPNVHFMRLDDVAGADTDARPSDVS